MSQYREKAFLDNLNQMFSRLEIPPSGALDLSRSIRLLSSSLLFRKTVLKLFAVFPDVTGLE
jgi:hypothetical protein